MSCPVDRPILSTITVGRICRYPRLAPSRVSARAANGRASARARSESATRPGVAPALPRCPLSSRWASGWANRRRPAVATSETTTTGMMAARRMAGIRSSWPRRRSRAMKLTSPTHAPRPADGLRDQEERDRGEEGPRDRLGELTGDHDGERQRGDRRDPGPDQVQRTAAGHVLEPRPGRGPAGPWPASGGSASGAPGGVAAIRTPPPGAGPGHSSRARRRRGSGSRAVPRSRCRRT